jgi:hypothetical protein
MKMGVNNIAKVYLGNSPVDKIFSGSNQVYSLIPPTVVDMVIIIGQSNADGRGAVSQLPSTLSTFYSTKKNDLNIYYKAMARASSRVPISYFVDDGAWWTLAPRHSAVTSETSMTILSTTEPSITNASDTTHGLELSLAYAYAQNRPNTEFRILKCAIGGSTITGVSGTWEIDTDADNNGIWYFFKNFIWTPAVADLVAQGKTIRPVFIWSQGESDAGTTSAPLYEARLQMLVDKIETELGLSTPPKIIISQLAITGWDIARPTAEAEWNVVKTAQENVCNANANCELFITDGTGNYPLYALDPADDLHYTSASLVQIGYDMYPLCAFATPNIVNDLDITAGNAKITVVFGRAFGAKSYRIEYKTTVASTWTTATTVYVAQTGYEITGLTNGTAYNVRIVTINDAGSTTSSLQTATPQAISSNTPLTDINPNIVIDLTAQYTTSYTGTGQTWANIAEGTTQPDFWVGIDGAVGAEDPTFVGTAGTAGAYWNYATGSTQRFTAKSLTDLMANMHRSDNTGVANEWTMMLHFQYPNSSNRYLCGTAQVGTTGGVIFQVATTNHTFRFRIFDTGTPIADLSIDIGNLVPASNNLVGVSFNRTTRLWHAYLNGALSTNTASAYTNTSTNALPLVIGADGSGSTGFAANTRLYNFAVANTALTGAEMTLIADEMLARIA